jgi:hypothetical protein
VLLVDVDFVVFACVEMDFVLDLVVDFVDDDFPVDLPDEDLPELE